MAGQRNLFSASGGGAASASAFAGSGLDAIVFSSELPKPVIYGTPVLRSPRRAPEVIRRQSLQAGHGTNNDRLSSY